MSAPVSLLHAKRPPVELRHPVVSEQDRTEMKAAFDIFDVERTGKDPTLRGLSPEL